MTEKDSDKNLHVLDMEKYKVEKLPSREKSTFEKWMARIGGPLAIVIFILISFAWEVPYLQDINPNYITKAAHKEYNKNEKVIKLVQVSKLNEQEKAFYQKAKSQITNQSIYSKEKPFSEEELSAQETQIWDSMKKNAFTRANVFMLAIFAAALILWITEAIPNYLTSLILIIALVLTGVLTETDAYHQLGHKVMWLNILSFILASMLVATQSAKRFALWFMVRFGKNATAIFWSFIAINLVLSAFISATTAKAAILLPIFMVISTIYGATGGKNRNNFDQ